MEYPSCQHIEQYLVPGKRCHLVGIGGVSMRPLGLVLRSMGMQISGSDMNASVSTDELMAKGGLYYDLYTMSAKVTEAEDSVEDKKKEG